VSVQSGHRARAEALVAGEFGTDPRRLPTGHFIVSRRPLERLERSAIERKVQVVFKPFRPFPEGNNPLTGRELGTREVLFRVGYLLTPTAGDGLTYDAQGGDAGASDLGSVEDRAETDAKSLREVIGWQPSWTGQDPHVIDCAPELEGDNDLIVLEDRAIREVRFILKTRAASTGYGPAQ